MKICAKHGLIGLGCLLAGVASGVTIESYGPFDVYYHESGEIFKGLTNRQTWTSAQREDVAAAIQTWDQAITSTPGRQIKMHVIWEDLPGYTLGGSSSMVVYNGSQRWQSGELIWREGIDPADYQIDLEYDTLILYDMDAAGYGWNFGSEAPGDSVFDFRSVTIHEIGHSLGMVSSYDAEYDVFGRFGGLTSWDMNLVDSMGNVPVLPTLENPGLFNASDSVFFSGYNATNLYGGLVPVYAPDPYVSGSSLSHLDENTFPNTLMTPFISSGEMVRSPGALELAMMTDMGWDVIPEPSTVVLVLLLSTAAFAIRRIFSI